MTRDTEKIKRGMPRSLIYVMIPLGFVLLVAIMLLGGEEAAELQEEVADEGAVAVEE